VGSPAEENGQWPLDAIPSSLPTTQLRSGRQSDGFSDIPPTKRPAFLPAQFAEIRSRKRSVFGYDRGAGAPAEAVVDAQGDHIDVLADPIVEKSGINRIDDRERVV
jgi:hypothetical protein